MILNGLGFTNLQSIFSFQTQRALADLKPFNWAQKAVPHCSHEEVFN